ncbi:MAG: glycoside hydrolase family 127 protein [Clostridia bacterium]|nr:glycoside hydrolase family 127 protein [Clostridia bacterium]
MSEIHNNKKPVFEPLNLNEIFPKGWYRNQLLVQKNGLTGHIEEIWDDLGPDSGWLGGQGESWERGPYYLDGLVPLAYLLSDSFLKKKAQKWIEWIFKSQTSDGFFGPRYNNDWWPRVVAMKAITQYHSATKDARVLPFMDRFFRYQFNQLKNRPFEMWGTARGFEELLPIFYLYSFTKETYLLELANDVLAKSYDWEAIFNDFKYIRTTHSYLNKPLFMLVKRVNILISDIKRKQGPQAPKERTREQIDRQNNTKNLHLFHETHSVNIAMAFKMPVLKYLLDKNPVNLETAHHSIETVMTYHGLTNHVFSGDEHLNGHSPTVGAELCLVAEFMYSLETMLSVTGKSEYADRLEQVAYNAWPATFLQDMSAHQYVQQVNQIEVSKKKRGWYDAFNESNIFGLEPNYGCCAANMHQGWPKLAGSILMKKSNGVATGIYAPCQVQMQLENTYVHLLESTEYPFNGVVDIHIDKIDNEQQSHHFPVWLRIPSWCSEFNITINNEALYCNAVDGYVKIDRTFKEGDVIRLDMELPLRFTDTGRNSVSVHYGALLMALPIKGKKKKLRGNEPFADWEIFPDSEWRYAVVKSEIYKANIQKKQTGDHPFGDENIAVTASLNMAPAPDWKYQKGNAGRIPAPFKVEESKLINMKLVPFGCTRLRIAEFPIAEIRE